jgi:hypothetical protein
VYDEEVVRLVDLQSYRKKHGISNRTATFAYATGVLTVTYVSNYEVYIDGVRYAKTTNQTVSIPANNTFYYVYFNAAGVLTATTGAVTVDDLTKALVALVYRLSASVAAIGDERHSDTRNVPLHDYLHDTIGARYDVVAGGLTGSFGATTFSLTTGNIFDEDLEHVITSPSTCRIWYRTALAVMTFIDAQTTLYKLNGTNIQYDNAGTLTDATNNWYVNHYVYGTNDVQRPIYSQLGQAQYASIGAARDEAMPSFGNLLTHEWKLLYRVTYRNTGSPPTYVEAADFRVAAGIPSTFVPTDHGSLTGLLDDDHTQYLLADGSRAASEITLTPKTSSSGPEGTIFYDSDDDHVYVATE